MSQHPRKWVAISDEGRVIATSESIEELTEKIKQLNYVLLAYLPTCSERKIGYLLQTWTTT